MAAASSNSAWGLDDEDEDLLGEDQDEAEAGAEEATDQAEAGAMATAASPAKPGDSGNSSYSCPVVGTSLRIVHVQCAICLQSSEVTQQ